MKRNKHHRHNCKKRNREARRLAKRCVKTMVGAMSIIGKGIVRLASVTSIFAKGFYETTQAASALLQKTK